MGAPVLGHTQQNGRLSQACLGLGRPGRGSAHASLPTGDASRQLHVVQGNLSVYQAGEAPPAAGVLVPGLLRSNTETNAGPPQREAALLYQKTPTQPLRGAHTTPCLLIHSRVGYGWEPYRGQYFGRLAQHEIPVWDYPFELVRDKQPCNPAGTFQTAPPQRYPPAQQRNRWGAAEQGSPAQGFLLAGLPPPGGAFLLPMKASNRAGEPAPTLPPDICILTLAMMIAGIPTVPVPGVREDDMIQAAQSFMAENPEQGAAGEVALKRRGDLQLCKRDRPRKRPVDSGSRSPPPALAAQPGK